MSTKAKKVIVRQGQPRAPQHAPALVEDATAVAKLDPATVDNEIVTEAQLGRLNFTIDMINRVPVPVLRLLHFEKQLEALVDAAEIQWGDEISDHFAKFVAISKKGGALSKFKLEFAQEIVALMCAYAEPVATQCGRILEALMALADLDEAFEATKGANSQKPYPNPRERLLGDPQLLLAYAKTVGRNAIRFQQGKIPASRFRGLYHDFELEARRQSYGY
jgi:hypothetical protein